MTSLVAKAGGMSFRFRLGLFVAAAVGVTVALATVASYFTVRHQLLSQLDSSLVSEVSSAPAISLESLENGIAPERIGGFLRGNPDSILQYIAPQGTATVEPSGFSRPSLPVGSSQAALELTDRAYSIETVRYDGTPYRVITEGVDGPSGPMAVQIGRPLSDIDHTLSDLRLIFWLVSLGGVAIAIGLAYLIGKATLRPVARLTAAAEHVAVTQDLAATIDERGDDELARLAHAFNAMLSALGASRQQQAQLISDAGHELRTPITSLRTNIEVLMRMPDLPPADRDALVVDVQSQLEELTSLIGDVVDLARDDERRDEPLEIRFDTIVERAVERARRRAPALDFETRITPGSVRAQPALLERAVLNVLDNAVKWSPFGGKVSVSLQRSDRWVLEIRDHGPGIAPQDLPHVFDRFYRADTARALPGSGLGLAIVRQVIAEHGGTVTASSPPGGGTLVRIELPVVAETEPEPETEPPTSPPAASSSAPVSAAAPVPWPAPAVDPETVDF